jgi:hypothetical protein
MAQVIQTLWNKAHFRKKKKSTVQPKQNQSF